MSMTAGHRWALLYDLGTPASLRGERRGVDIRHKRAKGQHWCPQAGRIAWLGVTAGRGRVITDTPSWAC